MKRLWDCAGGLVAEPACGRRRECTGVPGGALSEGTLLTPHFSRQVDRLWEFTATFASVSMREATKFNELGLHRFQGQTEFSQPFGKRFLSTESIRTKLETQHEVVDISHHAGLAA